MYERHENEQYFFDEATLNNLADFLSRFTFLCCLCAPLLGRRLAERGQQVRILDIDERFAALPGFRRYDIFNPEWLGEEFDLIICDPPFYNVSLSRLFKAIRTLARNNYEQPLLLSYLRRRAGNIQGTFARFGLTPTGYEPGYQTVQRCERNEVEFFSNLGQDMLAGLTRKE